MEMEDTAALEEYFEFAHDLAKKVGVTIKEAFSSGKSIETKSCVTDLVTETDQKVEKTILEAIKASYPTHKFIGEETVASGESCILTDDPTWVVDPIDGTTNFVHRFPYTAVCIGFVLKKQPVIGIVYNPILDEMFAARRGQGAFLNGAKLSVSKVEDFSKSLVMTECGSSRSADRVDMVFKNMQSVLCTPVHAIHSLGSAALNICMVARGGAEAYYEIGIHCWDFCAAGVILEEAGGIIMDTAGGPIDLMRRRVLAANNRKIGQSLSKAIVVQMELPHD